MSDRILPALGSSGTYELAAPYDTKVLPEEIYTCKGIRKLSEYISYNQDAKKTIYDYYGLTENDYENDIKEDMEIISLQNKTGVWLYVPARFILKYPIVNGIPYHQVALVCKLPAIETNKNLDFLRTDIGNLIRDYLGVDSIIDIVELSRVIAVTKEMSDIMTAERAIASSGRVTDRARYTQLLQNHNIALDKITQLETYIKDHI